jgi:hypothetical protein
VRERKRGEEERKRGRERKREKEGERGTRGKIRKECP